MKLVFKRSLAVFMAIIMMFSVMSIAGSTAMATEDFVASVSEEVSSNPNVSPSENTSESASVDCNSSPASSQESTSNETEPQESSSAQTDAPESSSAEVEASTNQQEESSLAEPAESQTPEVTPTEKSIYKGIAVTVKSAQGAFEEFTKTYQQGEVFDLTLLWGSTSKLSGMEIGTYFDFEGVRVLDQNINTRNSKGSMTEIGEDKQIENGCVTFTSSNVKGVDVTEYEYLVSYKVKVTSDIGTAQTITVDFLNMIATDGKYNDYDYISDGKVIDEVKNEFKIGAELSEPMAPVRRYTVVGHINGKDVGFDKDDQTIVPEYNFMDGKITCSVVKNEAQPAADEPAEELPEQTSGDVYTVVGSKALCGSYWDATDSNNDMSGSDGILVKTYENVEPGIYYFKIAKNRIFDNTSYGDGYDTFTVVVEGEEEDTFTVKITFDSNVGKEVTIPCTRESYVFVKTINTIDTEWYMFKEYTEKTSDTMYLTSEGSTEKMMVPAGYVTLKLAENEDGTLNLSYEADTTNIPTEPKVVKEYTMVGYINGEDVGFGDNAQSFVPDYNFVDNKLTMIFNEESYVFVKTTNNECWYMSEGYCTDTTSVMYDTVINQLGEPNKLYVPAGKVYFTLLENEDGSITLTYEVDSEYVPQPIPKEYMLVGNFSGVDVGCEGDHASIIDKYIFVKGNLEVEFEKDSYVFIKTTDNKNWYMFDEYVADTVGTLYNTQTGSSEKMLIPAGKGTIILRKLTDGSGGIKLMYIPYEEPTEPPTEKPTETVKPKIPTAKLAKTKLKAGATTKVVVSNAKGLKIKYKSLNTKVAQVNKNGVVTALNSGKAKISITLGKKVIKKELKVTSTPKIKIGKKLAKNKATIVINKGKKKVLTITGKAKAIKNIVKINGKFVKVASKAKQAKVVLRGLKKGKTTLKVKINGVKTYKYTIKVK